MGHIRLGTLPRSKRWKEVVELLDLGASSADVASATLNAADKEFARAATDSTVLHSFWLLTQLPDAARSEDFVASLADLGIFVTGDPSLPQLAVALTEALDKHSFLTRSKSDLGEMAQAAAIASLTECLATRIPKLFGPTRQDLRIELGRLATEKQLGKLVKDFFSGFSKRFLAYYISRELPAHVGRDRSFTDLDEHNRFYDALDLHCQQASRIVEKFAGAWYSKARYEHDLSKERASAFISYAFKKMTLELRQGA
jgi:hypothetical protein